MNNKRWWLVGGGVGVVLVAAFAIWFVFLRSDAPDAVDVDSANSQLDIDLGIDENEDQAETAEFDGDVNGTWVVDDEIGSFDFDSASGSFAGFRVDEELTVGQVVAVGRTGGVSGSIDITDGQLIGTEITVDMATIESNDSRREGAIRRAVGAGEFPTAEFALSGAVDLPDDLADGKTVTVEAAGDLTVKGVTRPVVFTIDALIRPDGFGVITGSTNIVFDDFGVSPPSAPIVVSVDDEGIVEFQLIVAKS